MSEEATDSKITFVSGIFHIYSQSLKYELITGDHRTNQIAWNWITIGLYLIICIILLEVKYIVVHTCDHWEKILHQQLWFTEFSVKLFYHSWIWGYKQILRGPSKSREKFCPWCKGWWMVLWKIRSLGKFYPSLGISHNLVIGLGVSDFMSVGHIIIFFSVTWVTKLFCLSLGF